MKCKGSRKDGSMMERYNNVVIGAGAAGLISAYISAAIKAKVALIEKHKMGGDCLNFGCVPSKALIRTARFVHDIKRHQELGIKSASYELDFELVMQRVRDKIKKIEPHDSMERYTSLGVDCFSGHAEIINPHTVKVGDRVLQTRSIILAMGASPAVPSITGLNQASYRTSENLWDMRELPRRLVVLGAGPIGCEMAQAFARLGSQVTLLEMGSRILEKEDEDVASCLSHRFQEEGIRILTRTKAVAVTCDGADKQLICESPTGQYQLSFDEILLAVGRKANTDGVDWQKLGIELNPDGTVKVDPYLRTSQKNIYACGDLIVPYQLTHVASHEAWYCAVNSLFSPWKKFKADYSVIPCCTFTDPEIAHVGHNENSAKNLGLSYEVFQYDISGLDRAITDSENYGFIKVLTRPGSDRIIGATIVSHLAGEMIGEFVYAMKYGIGLNKILGTIHAYPTFIEANKAVAGVWRKAQAPQWALKLLEHFHRMRR